MQPVFGRFSNIFKVRQPATEPGAQSKQPQPTVRLQSVAIGPVWFGFPVHATRPLNTSWMHCSSWWYSEGCIRDQVVQWRRWWYCGCLSGCRTYGCSNWEIRWWQWHLVIFFHRKSDFFVEIAFFNTLLSPVHSSNSLELEPNCYWTWTIGLVQGSTKPLEPNPWSSSRFRKNGHRTELNRTLTPLINGHNGC